MTPVPVPPEHVERWKEPLEWHFASFCRDGKWSEAELWDDVAEKRRQLWVVVDGDAPTAAVLTMVKDDPAQSFIVTHAAGRNRAAWKHFWDYLEAFARQIGCRRMEAVARLGWEPELKAVGMRKTHVIMEKGL